ncbi:hypothetical protein INR49_003548 [Caranx melampygus]|nr:hypothetical protein INR49_003548 [Caranx melampygus]
MHVDDGGAKPPGRFLICILLLNKRSRKEKLRGEPQFPSPLLVPEQMFARALQETVLCEFFVQEFPLSLEASCRTLQFPLFNEQS